MLKQTYGDLGQLRLSLLKEDLVFSVNAHINPLYTNSPHWSPYILLSTSWENLFKHQDNLSSVISSLILMTSMCYNVLI